jgi:hypothetical protein
MPTAFFKHRIRWETLCWKSILYDCMSVHLSTIPFSTNIPDHYISGIDIPVGTDVISASGFDLDLVMLSTNESSTWNELNVTMSFSTLIQCNNVDFCWCWNYLETTLIQPVFVQWDEKFTFELEPQTSSNSAARAHSDHKAEFPSYWKQAIKLTKTKWTSIHFSDIVTIKKPSNQYGIDLKWKSLDFIWN